MKESNLINRLKSSKDLLLIASLTFSILFLELALIRWIPTEIRLFAYLKNMVLLAVFLGTGLGIIAGRYHSSLINFFSPLLALLTFFVAFAKPLGWSNLKIPNLNIMVWGLWNENFNFNEAVISMLIFFLIFINLVLIFVACSSPLASLFNRGNSLNAYSADLIGAILGIIAFTVLSFCNSNPVIWIGVGAIFPSLLPKKKISIIFFILTILLAFKSMGHSIFSPYYRINVKKTGLATKISVDKAFFQHILNFAELTRLPEGKQKQNLEEAKHRYDLPYGLKGTQTDVLILGAGTGNDVQSAIRNKAESITAVEIDPVIIKLGKKLHPQKPYKDKRVRIINDDARAFLKQNTDTHYDLISYGLLDSHSMFSSVSSLRLDNFVYTEEGIKDAFKLLKPDGTLHISFWSKNYPWITERIYWTITKATGTEPIVYVQKASDSVSFLVNKNPRLHSELNLKESYMSFKKIKIEKATHNIRISNDNWPFLYLKKDSLPITYLLILVLVIILGASAANMILPKGTVLSSFDWPIFLMGVGFMLLETRSITAMSLIFGSTWLVNAFVFIGILVLALIANLYTKFLAVKSYATYYYLLFASLVLMWFLDIGFLNNFDLITRGCMAALIMGLPIGIAGVIVSKYLSESKDASMSLAANTLGAVLGVCLEYFSMIFGLQFLLVIAFVIYLTSFVLHLNKSA